MVARAAAGVIRRHVMAGVFNPHCTVCGRTAMQIALHPEWRCQRHTLPFDELEVKPVKAALKPKS